MRGNFRDIYANARKALTSGKLRVSTIYTVATLCALFVLLPLSAMATKISALFETREKIAVCESGKFDEGGECIEEEKASFFRLMASVFMGTGEENFVRNDAYQSTSTGGEMAAGGYIASGGSIGSGEDFYTRDYANHASAIRSGGYIDGGGSISSGGSIGGSGFIGSGGSINAGGYIDAGGTI